MTDTSMPPVGLRERRKQRTRLAIIETALELCDRDGFDNTTIDQIAKAAEVAPRTVSRYFATKEDVVLGPLEDYLAAMIELLDEQPSGGSELAALRDTYLTVLERTAAGKEVVAFARIQQMQRVIRSAPSVRARSLDFDETKSQALAAKIAARMGTDPDQVSVRLVLLTWRAVCHIAMDEWARRDAAFTAAGCIRAVIETFEVFEAEAGRLARAGRA